MNDQRLEVADVFRQHGQGFLDRWGHVLSPQQRRVFHDIAACRTAALGAHVLACDHCPHQLIEYLRPPGRVYAGLSGHRTIINSPHNPR